MVILGVDEVGRGSWAGPLVVGAVILQKPIVGLKDSKKLSKIQRIRLAELIKIKAVTYSLGWVTAVEIDTIGLTKAVKLAIERAISLINSPYDVLLIDGNYNYLPKNQKSKTLIKADSKVPAVSAASIIAKVARDDYMMAMSLKYPNYGFERHVGYGTTQHLSSIKQLGICNIHRQSVKSVRSLLK